MRERSDPYLKAMEELGIAEVLGVILADLARGVGRS
jgi:hypothetical protein